MIFRCLINSSRKMSHEGGGNVGVDLKSIVDFLQSFGPNKLAENWDNVGLLVEPQTKKRVSNVLLTNDLTEDVVKEALDTKADMIISYHPPLFDPLKRITTSTWKERVIGACIENKIAVYSPHTSWDSVPGGVNDWLASAFESESVIPIIPSGDSEIKNAGAGRYCKLKQEITLSKAVENVKALTSLPHLQIAYARGATPDTTVKDVAVCAGSGRSVLSNFPADLYVTGEMPHHSLLDIVHNGSSAILCNHSNSERGFLKCFSKKLRERFAGHNLAANVSKMDKDPLEVV